MLLSLAPTSWQCSGWKNSSNLLKYCNFCTWPKMALSEYSLRLQALRYFLQGHNKVCIFWEGHKIFAKSLPYYCLRTDKSKVKILQNFVAFSEYMNFNQHPISPSYVSEQSVNLKCASERTRNFFFIEKVGYSLEKPYCCVVVSRLVQTRAALPNRPSRLPWTTQLWVER